jgi:hypothetical protein
MLGDEPNGKEFALAYAQKFWDAGNVIVTLTFGVAFAAYLAIAQFSAIRGFIHQYLWVPWLLTGVSVIGNLGLIFVLYRICFHEKRIIGSTIKDADFLDSIQSAFEIRVGMLFFNTVLYLTVIWVVRLTGPST